MIKYVSHQFIDLRKYDECVKRDTSGLIYGLSWYLNTVCERWDALVLNDYDAVWPLPTRSKMGISYFYQPYGVQQLGIFSRKALPEGQIEAFILEVLKHCRYADICLNFGQMPQAFYHSKVKVQKRCNMVLDLNRPYQEIYEKYRSSFRRQIKKLNDSDLQLFEHDGPEVLLELFRETKGRQLRLPDSFYRNMKKIMYKALHKGVGQLYTVYGGPNMILAGAFFLKHQGRHIFLFSAVSALGKEYRAMPYLLNEYIIYHSEKANILDFEGSENSGTQRFYKNFGARNQAYPYMRYNGLPAIISWLKP